jgi:putative transposase
MHRVHKIKLNPTLEQRIYFARACGVARFAYNWALAQWKSEYDAGGRPNEAALRVRLNAIKAVEFPWMADVTKNAPQQAIKNVGLAFQHFFRRVKSGEKPGYPRFKKKGVHDSFRADNGTNDVRVDNKSIRLPRIGTVKMREALRFEGRILSAVVSSDINGWYVAVLVDTEAKLGGALAQGAVGVDLGLSAFATLSNGETVPALQPHRAAHRRLARLSRSLSRKQKGGRNRAKAKTKLARLHLQISNVRKDALHKLTTQMAANHDLIAIEDLYVAGMVRNRHLSRSIADSGWAEFRRQLGYKTAMTGATLVLVDRFYPSSKTCSVCGAIHTMPLSARTVRCSCGLTMDRDLNAAKNILRQALASKSVERAALAGLKDPVKPPSTKQKVASLCSYV